MQSWEMQAGEYGLEQAHFFVDKPDGPVKQQSDSV